MTMHSTVSNLKSWPNNQQVYDALVRAGMVDSEGRLILTSFDANYASKQRKLIAIRILGEDALNELVDRLKDKGYLPPSWKVALPKTARSSDATAIVEESNQVFSWEKAKDKFWNIPIEKLGPSVRLSNWMSRIGISLIGEVLEMLEPWDGSAMIEFRPFPEDFRKELVNRLKEKGYLPLDWEDR